MCHVCGLDAAAVGHTLDPVSADQDQLKSIAAKVMWWMEPEAALARPTRFVMQVMALGTWRDVQTVSRVFGWDTFCQVLDQAEAGVFDERSWAYWQAFFGRQEPALPRRTFA